MAWFISSSSSLLVIMMTGRKGRSSLMRCRASRPVIPRHVLVEEDEVEVLGLYGFDSVGAAEDGGHFVALLLEEEDMWLEQIDFVVCPEDLIYFVTAHTLRRYINLWGSPLTITAE